MTGYRSASRVAGLPISAIYLLICSPISAQQVTQYQYDALGRLIGATSSGSRGSNTVTEYDAAGNRKRVVITGASERVENESFEYPSIATYAYAPSAPLLVFTGLAGIARNGSAWGFPTPWNGSQVAFLQSHDGLIGIIEMRAVNLVVGKRYIVAFASSRRPGFASNAINMYVNTTLLWNIPPDSETEFAGHSTAAFVATAATATIRFESTPTNYDSSSGIDAVSVQQID